MTGITRTRTRPGRTRRPVAQPSQPAAVASSPLEVTSEHHPLFVGGVGLAFLALWLVALMMQIQTNEVFITQAGNVDIYKPDWWIILQIPNLVIGNEAPSEAIATIFGYGIELIYLGFIIGYEILQHSVERSGQTMARLFKVLSWAIIVFNGWTDYTYGTLGGGIWGHIGFALILSFIVGFFGTIGMFLIQITWHRA